MRKGVKRWTYGCHFDGLHELDTMGREGGRGREGGLTWLEVAVDDALGVGVGDCLEDSLDQLAGVAFVVVGFLDDPVKKLL